MSERLRIPLSKKKSIINLIVCSAFIILRGIPKESRFGPTDGFVTNFGMAFFGFVLLITIYRMLDPNAGFVIDDQGIQDHTTLAGVGLIRWNEIKEVELYKIGGQSILRVKLKNPASVLARVSGYKRFFGRLNNRYYQSPVQIGEYTLNYDLEELKRKIDLGIQQHSAKSPT